ncbi:MAG: DoxX family membrane protein [Candidatus Mycalebacterium zealandia]|nr:MAG: DoxX family membrane protein [Candidatus Mycalebacterium zealandia]
MRFLYKTDDNLAGFFARVALGAVMLPHGYPKLVNFERAIGGLTDGVGLPYAVAFLVIIGESVGAVSLIAGFLSRFCAFSIGIIMAGAIWMFHLKHGFFMNWGGNPEAGEGYEYHVLAIGLALVVTVAGGGRFSVDRLITRILK